MKDCFSNKVLKITFIKLLVYIYINTQLWITCLCMVYIIGFIFKIQISYMWFLQELKMIEILHVITLIFHVFLIFKKLSMLYCAFGCDLFLEYVKA
jgi:hypothetical protein